MSELAKALCAFQKDAPHIALDAVNPHYRNKYASLPSVASTVRPALAKQGLVVSQLLSNIDGAPALTTMLLHVSGEKLEDTTPLILSKQDMQAHGSALTYARRYALLSILGLVGDEDDDANSSVGEGNSDRSSAGNSPADPHGLHQSRGDAVQPQQMLVTFGKHKGKKVEDVPRSYWEWWLAQDGKKNEELQAAVEFHLGLQPVHDLDDIPFL